MKPSDFLTELSNEKLAQYKTAASADASKADKEKDFARGNKRFSGIVKATNKQFDNDAKKPKNEGYTMEDEQIDGMAQGEIREIIKNAIHIKNQLDKGVSLDGWMYSFVTVSNDKLNSVAEQINNPNIDEEDMGEGWSQKYKSSINCSHPKGFSQKAHCAGKKKHNESIEMEMTCPDCGMCQTHGDHENLDEACWKGYHKEGNKKMFGKTYPNCVKNEGVAEGSENFNGIDISMKKEDDEIMVRATAGGRELGHVLFVEEGEYLMPQDLEVEERFQGQGIAAAMYDYVKSKGYKIRRSGQQTDAGAGFWDKHKSGKNVWEQGMAAGVNVDPQEIANKLTSGKNLDKLNAMAHDSTIYNALDRYFDKHGIPESIYNRVAAIVFKKLDDHGRRLSTDPRLQGVAEGEYKSRHIHQQEQNKKYDEYRRNQEAAGKKPLSRGDWAATQRKGQQGVAEEQHSCPHCGGEMVSEELMNEKKDACYYKVKSRYSVWPSAYASGALVKCRKKGASNWGNGGKKNESSILTGIESLDESLHDWFSKEKWVRMDTKGNIKGPCAREPGEGKPKCLPQSKAHSLGKKGRASAAARKRREDPNPERHGKAINVNTKKETKG